MESGGMGVIETMVVKWNARGNVMPWRGNGSPR